MGCRQETRHLRYAGRAWPVSAVETTGPVLKRERTTVIEVGLSLGSNLGDRLANLRRARSAISKLAGTRIDAVSPVYETEPVGVPSKFKSLAFLNVVLVIHCPLGIDDFHALLRQIEEAIGRVESDTRNTPRVIDIDIIYAFGLADSLPHLTWICESAARQGNRYGLNIPHPRWAQRRFVVQPLADVRPDLKITGHRRTVAEVLHSLPAKPAVALFSKVW
ncbi:MAG: 2-amino-4-hydroxy-6-hydroxymethyldihydropteridine diphosphokinase [Verrucomicrobia bacterium]|nr:2-amino-4-hydroxy-6-hydroxymethyldihydropteridine diphosphokinase [Verrucomicrobiota bacterium]